MQKDEQPDHQLVLTAIGLLMAILSSAALGFYFFFSSDTDFNRNANTNVSVNTNDAYPSPFSSPRFSPWPSPTATPTPTPTLSFEALVENELKKLTEGRIVFNPPTTMQQGKAERIEARITSQDIGTKLTEGLKGRGVPKVENVKVGSFMKVLLYAKQDEFHITKLSSDEQVVLGQPYAQWDWMVTPLDYGEHSLHLRATASVVIDRYGEKSVDVPVIDRTINVQISPGYIVKVIIRNAATWQILLGGGVGVLILTGVFAAVRRWLSKRKIPPGFVSKKTNK